MAVMMSASPSSSPQAMASISRDASEKEWRCEVTTAWEVSALVKSPVEECRYHALLLEDRLELRPHQSGRGHGSSNLGQRLMRTVGAVAAPPAKVFMLDQGPLKVSARGEVVQQQRRVTDLQPSGDTMVVSDHEAVARICFPFESERESWAKADTNPSPEARPS